jgi:CDP-diacylglycerol--glycerol-3-phosphate 3-phosphatidyltransferase
VILIISREFAVSGLRSIAAAEGYPIRAGELGKSKMMFQVIGVALVMLSIRWAALRPYALAAMWGVVIFGLASAADYFRKFWHKVDTSIKLRRRRELILMERQKRRLQKAGRTHGLEETDQSEPIRHSG